VIERGCQIQQNHRSREDAGADNASCATTPNRCDDQYWDRDQSRHEADAMANAIGDLLSWRLRAFI
jgi:hypothetical protein